MDEFFGMLLQVVLETSGFDTGSMFDEDLYASLFLLTVDHLDSALVSLSSFYQQMHIEADVAGNASLCQIMMM